MAPFAKQTTAAWDFKSAMPVPQFIELATQLGRRHFHRGIHLRKELFTVFQCGSSIYHVKTIIAFVVLKMLKSCIGHLTSPVDWAAHCKSRHGIGLVKVRGPFVGICSLEDSQTPLRNCELSEGFVSTKVVLVFYITDVTENSTRTRGSYLKVWTI